MKKLALILAAVAVMGMVVGTADAAKKQKDPNAPAKAKKDRPKLETVRGTLEGVDTTAQTITIKLTPKRKRKADGGAPPAATSVTLKIGDKTQIRIDKDKVDLAGLAEFAGKAENKNKPVMAGHKADDADEIKTAVKVMVRTKVPEKKPRGQKKPKKDKNNQ